MYDEKLWEVDFFKELRDTQFHGMRVDVVLDSLTKVVLRKYILDYAKYLIDKKIPFSVQMIALDNTKVISENYGHKIYESVISTFADRLTKKIGKNGVVGRYSGEEFIVILPGKTEYFEVYEYIKTLFGGEGPLRTWFYIGQLQLYLTATIGSASYPNDTDSYEQLFLNADKALYRGISKGRNCFIVYVEEKHKDIDVAKSTHRNLDEVFNEIFQISEKASAKDFMRQVEDYIVTEMRYTDVLYFKNDSEFKGVDRLLDGSNLFASNDLKDIAEKNPQLFDYMQKNRILSVLIYRILYRGKDQGYLMFTEHNIERIWQEEDRAIIMYLARVMP